MTRFLLSLHDVTQRFEVLRAPSHSLLAQGHMASQEGGLSQLWDPVGTPTWRQPAHFDFPLPTSSPPPSTPMSQACCLLFLGTFLQPPHISPVTPMAVTTPFPPRFDLPHQSDWRRGRYLAHAWPLGGVLSKDEHMTKQTSQGPSLGFLYSDHPGGVCEAPPSGKTPVTGREKQRAGEGCPGA